MVYQMLGFCVAYFAACSLMTTTLHPTCYPNFRPVLSSLACTDNECSPLVLLTHKQELIYPMLHGLESGVEGAAG